jgi:hypothetical protein
LCELRSIDDCDCQFILTYRRTTAWNGKTHNWIQHNDGENDLEAIQILLARGFFSVPDLDSWVVPQYYSHIFGHICLHMNLRNWFLVSKMLKPTWFNRAERLVPRVVCVMVYTHLPALVSLCHISFSLGI